MSANQPPVSGADHVKNTPKENTVGLMTRTSALSTKTWNPTIVLAGLVPLLAGALLGLTTQHAAGADYSYTNSAPLTPTSGTVVTSEINVSGQPTVATDVNIGLNLFLQSYPADMDILLEGPTGVTVMLFSDAGGTEDVANLQIQIDDAAAGPVPEDDTPTSGAYKPTDYEHDNNANDDNLVPATTATDLSAFNGTNPNGTWKLYVADDAGTDMGGLSGGWTLNLNPAATCAGLGVTIMGTDGDDRIIGTDQPDVIAALGGNDIVYGLESGDVICGGAGDDSLRGGLGPDKLKGGPNTDICRGGAGIDTGNCETKTLIP